jgi:TolB protein
VSGGEARAVSEFVHGRGGYHTAPEWSPRGNHLVYSARANGSLQVVFADLGNGRSRLLTDRGRNEDPSWAPDGRHVVFASDRDGGGLYIVDSVSGRIRPLVRGWGHGLPAWSPPK